MIFDTITEKLIKLDVSNANISVCVGLDYFNSIIKSDSEGQLLQKWLQVKWLKTHSYFTAMHNFLIQNITFFFFFFFLHQFIS